MEKHGPFHEQCHVAVVNKIIETGEVTNAKEFSHAPCRSGSEVYLVGKSIWFPNGINICGYLCTNG